MHFCAAVVDLKLPFVSNFARVPLADPIHLLKPSRCRFRFQFQYGILLIRGPGPLQEPENTRCQVRKRYTCVDPLLLSWNLLHELMSRTTIGYWLQIIIKKVQIGIVSQLEFATVPLIIGRSKYSPSISQGSTTKPPNSIRNCLWFWIQIEPYLIGPVWICL